MNATRFRFSLRALLIASFAAGVILYLNFTSSHPLTSSHDFMIEVIIYDEVREYGWPFIAGVRCHFWGITPTNGINYTYYWRWPGLCLNLAFLFAVITTVLVASDRLTRPRESTAS